MSCGPQTLQGSGTVLSKGLAATPNFWSLTEWKDTNDAKTARAAVEMRSDTGSAQIAPAYQVCDDPDSPGTVYQLGALAYLQAEGIQYPTGYSDMTANTDGKQLVRWGVLVKQDADGAIQGCFASIKVDYRGQ